MQYIGGCPDIRGWNIQQIENQGKIHNRSKIENPKPCGVYDVGIWIGVYFEITLAQTCNHENEKQLKIFLIDRFEMHFWND